jgi:hypothetical protein
VVSPVLFFPIRNFFTASSSPDVPSRSYVQSQFASSLLLPRDIQVHATSVHADASRHTSQKLCDDHPIGESGCGGLWHSRLVALYGTPGISSLWCDELITGHGSIRSLSSILLILFASFMIFELVIGYGQGVTFALREYRSQRVPFKLGQSYESSS